MIGRKPLDDLEAAIKKQQASLPELPQTTLKPCPFCGAQPNLHNALHPKLGDKLYYYYCSNAKCASREQYHASAEEGISHWNARHAG